MIKKRGRPRQFDEHNVVEAAMRLFWSKGLTATSLDDLSAATGLTRPSLYNAFGNKESIYQYAFDRFVEWISREVEHELFVEPNLRAALTRFYANALSIYCDSPEPLGCFVTCTAPVESVAHPEIQADLRRVISKIDAALEKRLAAAQEEGCWSASKDPKMVAKLLHATLQSMAVRARAGEPRQSLEQLSAFTVDLHC